MTTKPHIVSTKPADLKKKFKNVGPSKIIAVSYICLFWHPAKNQAKLLLSRITKNYTSAESPYLFFSMTCDFIVLSWKKSVEMHSIS
jgi:hypothetical protein